MSGPYRGLSSDESAIEFATALHEQFSPMESSSSRTTKQIASELKRRGFDFSGVTEIVESRFKSFQVSEQQLSEVLDHPIDACHRSDLVRSIHLQMLCGLYRPLILFYFFTKQDNTRIPEAICLSLRPCNSTLHTRFDFHIGSEDDEG